MKTIRGLYLLLIIELLGCSPKTNFPTLSSRIYKNGRSNDKSIFNLSSHKHEARMKAYLADTTYLLKGEIDTLYFLEGYNIETATFYGTIWNRKKSVSYSYSRGDFAWLPISIFSDYQIKLVANWDTAGIRSEEKANGNWLDNNLELGAIRAFKQRGDWRIEEIYFKNFFDPLKDK